MVAPAVIIIRTMIDMKKEGNEAAYFSVRKKYVGIDFNMKKKMFNLTAIIMYAE